MKQEFQELAAELFEEFADFAELAKFRQLLSFSYKTQEPLKNEQELMMIALDYEKHTLKGGVISDIKGGLIETGSKMLIGEYQNLEWEPQADNTTVNHDGVDYVVTGFTNDPAKAVAIVHVRRL